MISAKDELAHLVSCLSEGESEIILDHLEDIHLLINYCDILRTGSNLTYAQVTMITTIRDTLFNCESIVPREENKERS